MEKMFYNLQHNTFKLMQICTDSLVRNLRLWSVQELVSSIRHNSTKAYTFEIGMKHKSL